MDSNRASISPSPAPPGRACTICARAKAKCVMGYPFGNKCERCNRLNKDCQTPSAARKRRTMKKSPTTKTTRLEEKLDGLVTLLKSAAVQSSGTASHNNATSEISTAIQPSIELPPLGATLRHERNYAPYEILRSTQITDRMSASNPVGDPRLCSPLSASTASTTDFCCAPEVYYFIGDSQNGGVNLSLNTAEEHFKTFRNKMIPYLPFIVLPALMSAQELRQERPFLWLCIMTVSSRSSPKQVALAREMRLTLGREVVLNGDRSLDLLLGVLVFVTWGHCHVQNRPITTNLMQIASGLLFDLGLNKPPPKESTHMMLNYDAQGCPKPFNPKKRTLEERRAAIGCFFTSSLISSYCQRMDALRWTSYLDECLQTLSENSEQPNDILLVQLVRLQLIIENLALSPWHNALPDTVGSTKVPLNFYLKSLQTQLQDFKQRIPLRLQKNEIILLHFYSTELSVHEVVLSKSPILWSGPTFHRLESLYTCLQATKSWFNQFTNLSPTLCVGFSISIFAQLAHCIVALYRLSTLEDPKWDRSLVRETLNLSCVLGEVLEKVAQIKIAIGRYNGDPEDDDDVFSETARRIGSIKAWWDAKLVEDSSKRNNAMVDDSLGERPAEFFDNAWLTDMLGLADCQFDQCM